MCVDLKSSEAVVALVPQSNPAKSEFAAESPEENPEARYPSLIRFGSPAYIH